MRRPLPILFLALGLLASLNAAWAQVPCQLGDDGFNTGCCDKPDPNLPDFPEVKVQGIYACLQDCDVDNAFKVDVKLSKPEFILCDTAVIGIEVAPLTPGGPIISGKLFAKYSRTWITTNSGNIQVWRFLLNGDWEYGPSIGVFGCPVPPYANPTHVIGSIDYSCSPISPFPTAQVALNLSHLPGCIQYGPLSARPNPGGAQDDRSYHLVAPSNFVFGAGNDIAGPFKEEAVRSSSIGSSFPFTYKCLSEAPVIEGEMASVFKNCLCTSLAGGPWVHSEMKGIVNCGGSQFGFNTVGNFDPVVPNGLAGLRLGRWVGPSYPGDLELTVYVGYMQYEDPCVPVATVNPDRVFGVGTAGVPGFLFSPSFAPQKVFVDLQDSLVQSSFFPAFLNKIYGAPAYGSRVWNLNPIP
ncbi:MAG: hypothetical protein AAF682_11315 [Planctomycetota bacterium]